MTEQQIAKLVGTLVEHQRFFTQLSSDDAQWAIQNTKEAIGIFCDAVKNRIVKFVEKLLEPFGTPFTVPAVKKFVAKEKFIVNTSEDARVCISWHDDNFKTVMLPKTEHDLVDVELRFSKLRTASLDAPIITELGDRAGIPLYAFYEALAYKQAICDYTWVVGYVRDVNDILWAVFAYWYGDGWHVSAYSVEYPHGWAAGFGFVSR